MLSDFPKGFFSSADTKSRFISLKRANHSKGWDAKPLAYIRGTPDTVAGLPGERSPLSGCDSHSQQKEVPRCVLSTNFPLS